METPVMTLEAARNVLASNHVEKVETKVGNVNIAFNGEDIDLVLPDRQVATGGKRIVNRQIGEAFGIHAGIVTEYRENADLLNSLINHSVQKRKDSDITIITNRDQILSVTPGKLDWLSPSQVFDSVVESSGGRIKGLDARFGIQQDGMNTTMRFVTDDVVTPTGKVGDVNLTGVQVICGKVLTFAAFVYRLACTNGMLRTELKASHSKVLGFGTKFQVEESLTEALAMARQFVSLDGQVEAEPAAFLAGLAHGNGIGSRNTARLLERVEDLGNSPSKYDIVNYVTALGVEHGHADFEWLGGSAVQTYAESMRWARVAI